MNSALAGLCVIRFSTIDGINVSLITCTHPGLAWVADVVDHSFDHLDKVQAEGFVQENVQDHVGR